MAWKFASETAKGNELTASSRIILVIVLFNLSMAVRSGVAEAWSGEDLYYTCAACHGAEGEGIAPLHAPKIVGVDARYLERQMNNYRTGIRGEHSEDYYGLQMVLFARTLGTAGEIERLSRYIVSFPDVPAVATVQGDAQRGREVYGPCAVCHGDLGEGNQDLGAPRLAGMDDWYLVSQLKNFRSGALGYSDQDRFGRQMRAAAESQLVDDAAIIDVVAHINVLGGQSSATAQMAAAQARPGERAESFFSRLPEDVIAITFHGGSFLPPAPAGIAKLDEAGLEGSMAVLAKLRDAAGKVVGFAAELHVPADGPAGEGARGKATDWLLVLPGRGTLYLAEIEQMGEFGEKVLRPLVENGTDWEGLFTQLKSVGRRPDGRGEIKGGTGEFDGARGSFVEIQNYTRATTAGELRSTAELRVFFATDGQTE